MSISNCKMNDSIYVERTEDVIGNTYLEEENPSMKMSVLDEKLEFDIFVPPLLYRLNLTPSFTPFGFHLSKIAIYS